MTKSVVLHLHENEKIIMILRRHWLVFVPHVLVATIMACLFMGIVFTANVSMSGAQYSDIILQFYSYTGLIWGAVGAIIIASLAIIGFFYARNRMTPTRQTAIHWDFIRRNWYVFAALVVFASSVVAALLSFLLIDIISNQIAHEAVSGSISDHWGRGALTIFSGVYALSLLAYLYISWLDYYMDVFVITNRQILDIEQIVLFGRKISETNFQQIQNATSKVKGLLSTLLDIGTVFVETAGEKENFSFSYVQHPAFVVSTILEIQQQQWEYGNIVENSDKDGDGDEDDVSHVFDYKPQAGGVSEALSTPRGVRDTEELPIPTVVGLEGGSGEVHLGRGDLGVSTMHHAGGLTPHKHRPHHAVERRVRDIAPDGVNIIEKRRLPYSDGRVITPYGVLWQSNTHTNDDVTDLLNKMDRDRERT